MDPRERQAVMCGAIGRLAAAATAGEMAKAWLVLAALWRNPKFHPPLQESFWEPLWEALAVEGWRLGVPWWNGLDGTAILAEAALAADEWAERWQAEIGAALPPEVIEMAPLGQVVHRRDKKTAPEEIKPAPTGRKWKGEHFNAATGQWEDLPGHWYNHATGQWEPGDRDLDYFHWYQEFIWPEFGEEAKPMGEVHRRWAEEIESDNKVVMLKPRDHYKTSFISIGYGTYALVELQIYPILIVSLSEANTIRTYSAIRYHLAQNLRILSFYGYIIDEDRPLSSQELFTYYHGIGVKDATLFCATFGSNKVMGTHPKLAILDDIQQEPLTPTVMRKATQLIDANLIPAVGNKGKLIIVGTIKGYDATNDIYLYCEAKGDIFSVYRDAACYLADPKTGGFKLDKNGEPIPAMPPLEDVKIIKHRVPKVDANGNFIRFKSGSKKGQIRYEKVMEVKIRRPERYRPLYPEGYSLEDLCVKRQELTNLKTGDDSKYWSEFFQEAVNPSGKFFPLERILYTPPPPFANWAGFFQAYEEEHHSAYMWMDPGGKDAHGSTVAVLAKWKGAVVLLDVIVFRTGIREMAAALVPIMRRWNVRTWGVEGNYAQKQTYGDVLQDYLYEEFQRVGRPDLFTPNQGTNNKGDKILRIQQNITPVLGRPGTPPQFFINPHPSDLEALAQLRNEFRSFPNLISRRKHEYDLLDAIASILEHLIPLGNGAFYFYREVTMPLI